MASKVYWSPHGGITRTWSVDKLVAEVAEAGYAGIEALVNEQWMNWRDPGDVQRLRALIESHGLECPAVCWRGNQGDLLFTDPRNHATSRAYLAECIEVASRMGAGAVLVWPRVAEGVSRADALAAAARVLNDVSELCRERAVVLSLEFESVGQPLCGTPAETIELIELTGDFVTICCDTFHLYNRRLDPYASVLAQRGRIGLVHLSDGERQVPGDGDFDFAAFIKGIQEVGYGGPVFVQIDPRADGDLARAATRALEIVGPLRS
jgi:D-psicose/D-tagatose/L-ribulose 3-epimerase